MVTLGAAVLALIGVWAAVGGAQWLRQGLRTPDDPSASLWIVRGLRGTVVAIALGALAGGLLSSQTWLLAFGLVFLAEEIYETTVLALVLRLGPVTPAAPSR